MYTYVYLCKYTCINTYTCKAREKWISGTTENNQSEFEEKEKGEESGKRDKLSECWHPRQENHRPVCPESEWWRKPRHVLTPGNSWSWHAPSTASRQHSRFTSPLNVLSYLTSVYKHRRAAPHTTTFYRFFTNDEEVSSLVFQLRERSIMVIVSAYCGHNGVWLDG